MKKKFRYIDEGISIEEACKLIGTKFTEKPMYQQLLRHYINKDIGPECINISGNLLFLPEDVVAWVKPPSKKLGPRKKK